LPRSGKVNQPRTSVRGDRFPHPRCPDGTQEMLYYCRFSSAPSGRTGMRRLLPGVPLTLFASPQAMSLRRFAAFLLPTRRSVELQSEI